MNEHEISENQTLRSPATDSEESGNPKWFPQQREYEQMDSRQCIIEDSRKWNELTLPSSLGVSSVSHNSVVDTSNSQPKHLYHSKTDVNEHVPDTSKCLQYNLPSSIRYDNNERNNTLSSSDVVTTSHLVRRQESEFPSSKTLRDSTYSVNLLPSPTACEFQSLVQNEEFHQNGWRTSETTENKEVWDQPSQLMESPLSLPLEEGYIADHPVSHLKEKEGLDHSLHLYLREEKIKDNPFTLSQREGRDLPVSSVGGEEVLDHNVFHFTEKPWNDPLLKKGEDRDDPFSPLSNKREVSSHFVLSPPPPPSMARKFIVTSRVRQQNWFDFAHCDNFGVLPTTLLSTVETHESMETESENSSDEDYSSDESDTNSSFDSTDSSRDKWYLDTSKLSLEDLLKLIHKPNLIPYEAKHEDLNKFLNPHDVGHINFIIRCYSDAVFSINIPSSLLEARVLSPINYINIHMCGVFQVYYIMFKCKEFRSLKMEDQVSLLEINMIPILISLGLHFYDHDLKSWVIPFVLKNTSFTLPLSNLLQIIPEATINKITLFHEITKDLSIDWTMSLFFALIIVYTPVGREITELDFINKIRDKYIHMLLNYIKWKFGAQNVVLLFPELLKILDTLLKFSEELNSYRLQLSDEEFDVLKNEFKLIEGSSSIFSYKDKNEVAERTMEDIFRDNKISYSSFHSKLTSVFLKLGNS